MTLRIEQTAQNINPFEIIDCPKCHGTEFASIDHSSVWCSKCTLQFRIRTTAGDPGFVVDAYGEPEMRREDKHKNVLRMVRVACRVVKTGEYDSDWMYDHPEEQENHEHRILEPPCV